MPIRLMHINTVPKSYGQLRGQLAYISRHGFEVWCISSPEPELERIGEQEGVRVHPVSISRAMSPLRDVVSLYGVFRFFLRQRPTIVHAHTPKGAFLGVLAAWMARIPIRIYHVHGLRFVTMTGWRRRLLFGVEKVTSLLATKVYCVSRSVADVYCGMGLCPEAKISVPVNGSINGVDAIERFDPRRLRSQRSSIRARYNIPREAIVIGFVGRIGRDKGVLELFQAWQQLRARIPNVHMLFVGPWEDEDPLPSATRKAIVADPHIHLVGLAEEPAPYYSAMDIYALPSHREGFGTTSLEAAAMELPVVTTRVPGCIDAVVDGVTGTLVEPRDAECLAEALRSYATKPEMRLEHGRNGRSRALRDFKPTDIWQFMLSEYSSLIEGIPGGDLS